MGDFIEFSTSGAASTRRAINTRRKSVKCSVLIIRPSNGLRSMYGRITIHKNERQKIKNHELISVQWSVPYAHAHRSQHSELDFDFRCERRLLSTHHIRTLIIQLERIALCNSNRKQNNYFDGKPSEITFRERSLLCVIVCARCTFDVRVAALDDWTFNFD